LKVGAQGGESTPALYGTEFSLNRFALGILSILWGLKKDTLGETVSKLRIKIQIAMAALLNLGVFQLHYVCVPVLNCHSCPTSLFACPLGVIGQFASLGIFPLSVIGLIALGGLLLGRFLCGWACPFGLLQDLLYRIPYLRFEIPSWTRYIKYATLGIMVIGIPYFLSPSFDLYFCRVCPVGTIESAIPWAIINGSANLGHLAVRLAVLFGIMILAMGHLRFFCKVLCPLGAMLSVFNRFAAVFPERTGDCIECGACAKACPMTGSTGVKQVAVFDAHPEECISCLECHKKCPTSAVKLWG
jgi:polyferredoxin